MTPPPASTAAARLAATRRMASPTPSANTAPRRRPGSVEARRPAQVVKTAPAAASPSRQRAHARSVAPVGQNVATAVATAGRTASSAFARRVSGPLAASAAAPLISNDAIPARIPAGEPLGRRLALVVRHAPDLAITHRIARGRMWIGLLAAGLIGIVFLQVMLLGMNSGIGRDVTAVSQLQRQNAELKSEVSGLASETRIVAEAQRMGFVEPPVGSSRFVAPQSGDAQRAASTMSAPTQGPDAPQYGQPSSSQSGVGQSSTGAVSPTGASATLDSGAGSLQSQTAVAYTPANG